ncbi:MAG: type IX secretion system sortase PorU [Bacteroidales bacterium]|nr:type IX secretion system sortase PorU [Bacteroidales bacterium]
MCFKKGFVSIISFLLSSAFSVTAQTTTHSVLSSGDWWRIEIAEDGIYKLTSGDISALASCHIADIAVFGHEGGELPTRNGDERIDDLDEIAIEVHDGNSNGLFDSEDYILFYACGADKWEYNETSASLHHQRHHYSSSNYVFLTIKEGLHKRVAPADEIQATSIASTCHSVAVYDIDLTNTHQSGLIWVNKKIYGNGNSQNVTLSLPSVASGKIKVRYALASISTASSSFTVSFNGVTSTHSFNSHNPYNEFFEEFDAPSSTSLSFTVTYNCNESMAAGYIDYFEVDATTPLSVVSGQNIMRLAPYYGAETEYSISGASNLTRIWDVTDYNNTVAVSLYNNNTSFNAKADRWRTLVAFSNSQFKTPASITGINNQDLHGSIGGELIIVCNKNLVAQAERLASIHSINDYMQVAVFTQDQVFNEFGSGRKDPMAIREMLRYFRKNAESNSDIVPPRHLLLMGKGTYDNRNILGNDITTVVTFQTLKSFDDDGESMATDDILTYLDDNENLSSNSSMDISVGRLPAKNIEEARHMVDKIENYITRRDLTLEGIRGDWRNSVALLADDADPSNGGDTAFTWSSEVTARQINEKYPHLTVDKIYADAYVQRTGADGSYYPDVNNALKKRIDYGCLLLNYIGHGSSQYIGTERFMMKSDISTYTNYNQLPFFITSTCTFGRYDDPDETCGAEEFLLANGAGIACLAASRPISHIQSVNTDMVMQALDPANTIGDAVRIAKNHRVTTQALTLIGDPALRLSHPTHKVVVTSINGHTVDSLVNDTALVLSTVTVEGEIHDNSGNLVSDFDGDIFPEVYDRPISTHTLANDNTGYEVAFTIQNNLIYKGRAAVTNGRFSYRFTVPRDVAYKFERARLSHYAKSATEDASGAYLNLFLGGFDESAVISETRPEIRAFINDTNFRNGAITDANPTLLVLLYDSVGINAVGSGLGHDITAVVDGNPNSIIILNDLYETDFNDEHRGSIRYNMSGLTPGRHTITVKAWNIFNYSNSAELVFYVHSTDTVTTQFSASPNPSRDHTCLRMEHNCKGTIVSAQLDIFNTQGQLVASFTPAINPDSFVIGPVDWNLNNNSGVRVAPGIYIARFIATTSDGEKLMQNGKIVVR